MKSSCSARGLSASQNLPEIALILSVSPSSDTLSFRLSLYSCWSTHPHTHSLFISPYWSAFSCLLLPRLFPLCPLQILSLRQCVSSPAVFHQYEFTQLICNRHFFCQHLGFLMSQFLTCFSAIYNITFYSCLSLLHSIMFLSISILTLRDQFLLQFPIIILKSPAWQWSFIWADIDTYWSFLMTCPISTFQTPGKKRLNLASY